MTQKSNSITTKLPIPLDLIKRRIYVMRGQEIMLDSDLAELYQVPTSRLNEAVKRNHSRFPSDFMFQLSLEELKNWRSQIAMSNPATKMGLRRPPYAFTEHGVVMLSAVLNSERAIQMNIFIVRAFIQLRKMLATHIELSRRLIKVERTQKFHGQILTGVVQDIKRIKNPPKINAIGFQWRTKKYEE